MCAVGELDGAFCELVQCACPAGPCSLKVEVPSCAVGLLRSAEDLAPELLPRTDVTTGVPIQCVTVLRSEVVPSPHSPHGLPPGPPCTISLSTLRPGNQQLWPYAQCPAAAFPALGPEDAADPVAPRFPEADAQALPSLRFRVQITPEADRCLVMDFGDGSGVQMRTHRATGDVAVTTFHRYRREGVYALQTVLYSESHGAEVRLGPYYVELGPEATSVFLNASSGLRGPMCAFGRSPTDLRSTTVSHHFPPTSSCNVSFALQTHVGGRRAWSSMAVRYRMQPVSVYTNGTVFATDTDITFVAVTKETTPLEFTWFFGADLPVRTRRSSIQRRLGVPQWYHVVVQASNGMGSVASEPRRVQVQRRVVASGLVAADSALVNTPVTFQCRVSFGTDVAYRWDFGDGTGGLGNSSASHVYSREGEFTVEVVAFNAVSTVSLRKRLFVVRRPCQPPPVKNMGPGQVQVWRSQPVTLGVTFEAAILCDISQGLSYSWSLTNSAGSPVPLPPAISTHRQTFTVPHYFLEPGNYTALAQVQVRGSPVHSNYCVGVEVRARAPVSVISEGTHLFVPRTPLSTMVLRGSLSYDPDRPGATLRYHWACTPASAPGRPCFAGPSARSPDAGAPTLSFTADSLSSGYDQFLVTLTVSSHGRNSSEAQVFLSTLPDVALRRVHISWERFRGIPVNWNEELSLRAACEDCGEAALSYSWDLFLVNATGRDREEVPFCRTVGLLGSSGLGSVSKLPESYPRSPRPRRAEPHATPMPFTREPRPWTLDRADLSATGRASVESTVPAPQVPAAGDPVAPEGDPWDEGSLGSPTPHPPGKCCPLTGTCPRPGGALRAWCSSLMGLGESTELGSAHTTSSSFLPNDHGCPVSPLSGGTGASSVPRSVATQGHGPVPWQRPAPQSPSVGVVALLVGGAGTATASPLSHVLGVASGGFVPAEQGWGPEVAQGDVCAPSGSCVFQGSLVYGKRSHSVLHADFEAYYSDIQEAEPSRGRQPAAWTSMHLSASGPSASEDGSRGDGDNLVGPFLPTASARPALLVDWPKSPVSRAVFQGYTASGITGQTVTVKPHSLRPGETYVLQAAVASGYSFLGKAQLYVTVNQAPRDVACQVQPHRGLEADTVFSVFCTSGRPDFRYEFGYQIGNASKCTLYRGTDAQHYFALPAGEPVDGYQVLVSTVITDGDGSQTQPCAVAVTVLPRLHGDRCPGEDVYNASLRNLSTLQQMGSDTEVRNYVAVTTGVLSRWAREGGSPSCGQWSRIQDAFISSICRLAPQDQEEATDSVLLLRDLLRFPNKMSLASALLILDCAHTLLAPGRPPAGCAVEAGQVRELILLVSGVLEASDHGHSRSSGRLLEEGAQVIADVLLTAPPALPALRPRRCARGPGSPACSSQGLGSLGLRSPRSQLWAQVGGASQEDAPTQKQLASRAQGCPVLGSSPGSGLSRGFRLLGLIRKVVPPVSIGPVLFQSCLSSRSEHRVHVSAGQTEVQAQLHRHPQSSVQSLGPVQVRLPADLARWEPSPCYASQLLLFRRSPFLQGRAPGQVGALLALSLHRCSSRRPLHRPRLRTPVTAEFGEEDGPGDRRNETTFVLLRDRVNVHHFAGLSAASPEALQIRVEFSQPAARAFPVMLLVRFSEKPTPANFLLRQLHLWEGLTAHVSVPAAVLEGHTQGYLSLLDADYDRESPNRYLAETVSYVVRFQGVHCLLWDPRREPESLPPQPAAPPGKVNCSYNLLAAYSIARRSLNASFESRDIAQFRGRPENLLPSIFIVAITILYALLVTKSKRMDRREKKKTGYIFLQDSAPPSHQLYAVVVDTGFRAPARFTAKVYIVLCGEDGLSEPRELCCPEKPLFERNSRHTFVLSTPAALGPLRKVRLWHDSSGACPAWYVSHVMVKELRQGRGRWFFPAECWLAAGRRDGRVERELACLRGGLGFRKLLFSRFTEQLEDLHVWASVHSRPAGRGLLHTPRLSVAFALLCAYACLAALVTTAGHGQLPPSVGPAGVPLGSFWTGFLCTLLASPGAQLLSLLFRLSQRSAPAVLCGGAQAQSAASGDGATQPPPELEACGAELGQWALGEKRDCIPGLQAPNRAFEGHVTTPWPRAPRPWLRSAAWAICGMVSVACGVGTVFLGYRFGPTQCGQWLCLLTISVTCCVFVTQPLMVGLVALGFAWKRRDDESFFTESLQEATEGLGTGLAGLSCTHVPHAPCCSRPRGPGVVERLDVTETVSGPYQRGHGHGTELGLTPLLCSPRPTALSSPQVLAGQQRARRLRRAHPPSTAWLRATRERMRRQTRTQAVLRDTCMSVLMLLLHLLITHATSPRDEHSLSHAIRNTFARGARSSSGSLSSVDAWWDWSLTTLLDGVYPVGVPGAQPGALGGTCYLIGPAVLKQIKLSPGPSCELPRPLSVLPEDSLPTCHPKVRGSETPSVTNAETQRVAPSDPTACREHCELSLGRTRPAARAVLTGLRSRRWVDHHTRAVSVHFVLYNPPTRLFSRVSLRAALLPAGGLALSPLVESVTVVHSDPAPRYHLLLPQLAFLALTLTHLCLQLFRVAEEGVRGYWKKPGAWLELPLAGAGLAWYAASGHLLSLAGEVTDQLHMGLLRGSVDLSPMASWNQRARWLQGTLSFLLTLKCLRLLGSHSAVASCIFATRRSLAGVLAPGLAGVLVLAAHAHLRGILLLTVAPPSGTFADASHRFPGSSQRDTFPGLSKVEGRATAGLCTALLAAVTALWMGMLRGSLMAFVPKRKSFQSQSLVRLADVMAYVWGAACSALGLERRPPEEAEPATHHNPSLDEFADLLDELLLKIDSLSARLPLPLPAQPPRDAPQAGARAEGSPSLGASDDQAAGPSGIEKPLRPGLC
ncbi:polycystin-1-like protein 1 [Myotis daubentonii]|uniref:polycystin-1-like protein 1 n=1 Tax=Myotis daubentonii TaxID=98922 RepID=UPI0028738D5B|nr:polycystin-1-like protein 1 [Myotis daubentonii]